MSWMNWLMAWIEKIMDSMSHLLPKWTYFLFLVLKAIVTSYFSVSYVDFLKRFSGNYVPPKFGQKFDIIHHKLKNNVSFLQSTL